MKTLPLSKVKDQLSELVESARTTRDQITITKNGVPAAVLVGSDEWEELQETLFWLSQPGILDDIAAARKEFDSTGGAGEEAVRARYGVPKG